MRLKRIKSCNDFIFESLRKVKLPALPRGASDICLDSLFPLACPARQGRGIIEMPFIPALKGGAFWHIGVNRIRCMEDLFYSLRPTPFGTLAIVWMRVGDKEKICRVFLPDERIAVEELVRKAFPFSKKLTSGLIEELGRQIDGFLGGEPVVFALDTIHLDQCPRFQRGVLLAEHRIPRGWVSTYGRIARHLGVPGGARAVGGALSRNPFPIIIPCHRAIRSDGELGGFQGGMKMKRTLLELEGIRLSPTGKVRTRNIFY